jgi:cyclopropane-fatty-acyl-phospholipid synthase
VAFETGSMCNFQVQYLRDRNAVPITRDYMIEAEAKYRALDAATRPAPKPKRAGRRKMAAA